MDETFFDEIEVQKKVLADQDLSDEFQIKLAISEFYVVAKNINEDNKDDIVEKLRAHRNVVINMMRVYLAKFNNNIIINDFEKELKKAKNDAIKNGKVHFYIQFLNEIQVVGTFLGIRENISEKLSEQILDAMMKEENGGAI